MFTKKLLLFFILTINLSINSLNGIYDEYIFELSLFSVLVFIGGVGVSRQHEEGLFDKKAPKEEDKKLIMFMTREKSGFETACEYFVDKCSKYNGDVAFHWKKEELMIRLYSEDSKKGNNVKDKKIDY